MIELGDKNMSEVLKKLREKARRATYTEVYVTVAGGRSAVIENVTHVYECNEILARIKTADGDISIWGEELKMSSFKEGIVRINGRITSVEFTERAGVKDD